MKLHLSLWVLTGVVGFLAVWLLPFSEESRWAARLGLGLSWGTGGVALLFKRWAAPKGLGAAFGVVGAVFAVRLLLVLFGMFFVAGSGSLQLAYAAGFFGSYVVLQWIEVSYVLAESKRLGPGAQ